MNDDDGQATVNDSARDGWVLAIDFGTSFTVAASRIGDRPAEVLEIDGERRVPSVLLLDEDGDIVVGRAAEHLAATNPGRLLRAPKSRLGEPAPVVLGGTPFPVRTLVADLLRHIYENAVRYHGCEPDEVRLTHPATWSGPRRRQLVEAAATAGIDDPVLVPEPVAAAIAYADDGAVDPGGHVLVYDLGGGTFDTAALESSPDGFVVLGRPGGDPRLGGELFDELLAQSIGEQLDSGVFERIQLAEDELWRQAAAGLRRESRRVKEALSSHPYAELLLGLPTGMVQQRVVREQLHEVISPYIEESVDVMRQTASGAGLDPGDVASIYLVGGASRTPLVEEQVRAAFPGVPVSRRGDPKGVVALGATSPHATPTSLAQRNSVDTASTVEHPAPPPPAGPIDPPSSDPPSSDPPSSEVSSQPSGRAPQPAPSAHDGSPSTVVGGPDPSRVESIAPTTAGAAAGAAGGYPSVPPVGPYQGGTTPPGATSTVRTSDDARQRTTKVAALTAGGVVAAAGLITVLALNAGGDDLFEGAPTTAPDDSSGGATASAGDTVDVTPTVPVSTTPLPASTTTTTTTTSTTTTTTVAPTTLAPQPTTPTRDEVLRALINPTQIDPTFTPTEILEGGEPFCTAPDDVGNLISEAVAFERIVAGPIVEQISHGIDAFDSPASAQTSFDGAVNAVSNCDRTTFTVEGFTYDMLILVQPLDEAQRAIYPCADQAVLIATTLTNGPPAVPALTQQAQSVRCGSNVSTTSIVVTAGVEYLALEQNLLEFVEVSTIAGFGLTNLPGST
ncbi:MAG: Hsp70 family protein [Actinomycetota bacterium]